MANPGYTLLVLTRTQFEDGMTLVKKYKDIATWRKLTKKERGQALEDMLILRDQLRVFKAQNTPQTPEEMALMDLAMELDQEAIELERIVNNHYLKAMQAKLNSD